jgi:hypothetical protein
MAKQAKKTETNAISARDPAWDRVIPNEDVDPNIIIYMSE